MVAVTADKVIVELEARLDQYNVRVNGARQNFQQSMRDIGRHGTQAERLTRRNFGGMASAIAAVEGPLGGTAARFRSFNAVLRDVGPAAAAGAIGIGALAIGLTQVTQLADKFTRFENRLKTAGLEGENLARVGDRLFDIANRNGVEIEALGSVYARASLAADELGASQGQLDTFTRAVSDALRVQGSSAEASRGALLQLSQALGQDIVRAEEFNSILEGALPIAQAAARGIERFEGSVARLRTAIVNGEVTSREFFEGILRAAPSLAEQAAKANLTLENSFTALYNQLARGIGQTDKSLGATEKLSEGIIFLANNLGILGEALAIITAALGARLVTALGRAATEQASYYAQVARGNVVTLGSVEADKQRARTTLLAARADEQAAASALAKARAAHQSAIVSTTDTSAQFQRAAATRQLTILEGQATAATARRIVAENAHVAALARTTAAARAAAVATRAYASLSGVLGGPLGIALTAIAGTYLIVSNRTAAAAERTRDLQAELRQLGYLAEEADGAIDGMARSLNDFADDELRRKLEGYRDRLEELTEGGAFGPLAVVFDPSNIPINEVESLVRQWEAVNVVSEDVAEEMQSIAAGVREGSIGAEELDRRLKAIAALDLGENVDNLTMSLRSAADEARALNRAIDDGERALGIAPGAASDRRSDMMRRRARLARERAARGDFLGERNRASNLDEEARAIEKRADAIEKEAEKLGVVLSREQALAQARKEIDIETGRNEGERLSKMAEQDAQVLADLQRAIQTFGDERQQAIDRAVGSLSESASAAEIERVKQLAGQLYDLAEARRIDAIINSEAKDEAIQGLRDEAAQLGVVGGALVQLQFEQQRLNELRAEGIEITPQLIEMIRQEGEAVRRKEERTAAQPDRGDGRSAAGLHRYWTGRSGGFRLVGRCSEPRAHQYLADDP
ncbi:MAG: tape measure protein [Parvibaculaceae bacterium]|nr:tape measure protein [Parvibaculaceae bacterium]